MMIQSFGNQRSPSHECKRFDKVWKSKGLRELTVFKFPGCLSTLIQSRQMKLDVAVRKWRGVGWCDGDAPFFLSRASYSKSNM
jgi:hypothetical protein